MTAMPLVTAEMSPLTEGVMLTIVGMTVVFGSLIVLLFLVRLIGAALSDREKPVAAPAAAAVSTAPAPASSGGVDDGALIAVLSAAAAAVVGRRVRIQGVRMVTRRDRAWSQQGRRSIMTSHRPQR
ncbi:OadG family protein [Mucisphaera calidilacus]|uniref:Oxaloacetate decarboxylase gamma chain n=1 Tax=Mucisphaera calidilacus TaxID=2527982 RepID=A0A518C0N6_9BACT|nr:OadG family protein [Mucisphaera calidilacus]QDU72793.1 oxaloacetate decarboxylase gamma chain [Mucisphaera calidilacus]